MSRRTERLASLIRRIVAEEIQNGLHDPRIAPLCSITRVELSEDLSFARIFVSVVGDEKTGKLSIRALQHAAGHMQSVLAKQIRVRQIPKVLFTLDESLKRGFEIVQLIDQQMAELSARTAARDGMTDSDKDVEEAT